MHFITPSEYSCTVDNYFSPGLQEPSALEHLWPYYGTYFQSQYVCPLAPIWFMDPSATLLTASPFDQFGIPASVFLQPFPSLSQIQITTDLSRHFPLAANRPLTAKHCPGKYFDPSSAPFLTSLCPLGKLREELKNENNLQKRPFEQAQVPQQEVMKHSPLIEPPVSVSPFIICKAMRARKKNKILTTNYYKRNSNKEQQQVKKLVGLAPLDIFPLCTGIQSHPVRPYVKKPVVLSDSDHQEYDPRPPCRHRSVIIRKTRPKFRFSLSPRPKEENIAFKESEKSLSDEQFQDSEDEQVSDKSSFQDSDDQQQ